MRSLAITLALCLLAVGCKTSLNATGECSTGETRACAVRVPGENGTEVVSCIQGTQTCTAARAWSECATSGTIISNIGVAPTATGTITTQGGPTVCDDPCNPACRYFTPDDGGLTAPSSGSGGYNAGNVPLSALPSGWTKVNKSPCTGPADCQFDSKCVAGVCVSFLPGESGSCTGVDLTSPPSCDTGSGVQIPICNRGTTTASTGTVKVGIDMNPPPGGTCAPTTGGYPSKGSCTVDLTKFPIAAGKCINIDPTAPASGVTCSNVNISGNRDVFVNYDGVLSECNKCNNEGMKKSGVTCTTISSSLYTQKSYTSTYTATCSSGKVPQWNALAWIANVPTGTRVTFSGRVGTNNTWSSSVALGDTSKGDPATCGMFGPSPCPKDLATLLKPSKPTLELTITVIPSADGLTTPTVNTWQVTYNCVDSL